MKTLISILSLACALLAQTPTTYIVEGDRSAIRAAVHQAGGTVLHHPDLLPNQVMVRVDAVHRGKLPGASVLASDALIRGERVFACPDGITPRRQGKGRHDATIVTFGDGWEGPGQNAAFVRYWFDSMVAYGGMSPDQLKLLAIAALRKWSQYAAIDYLHAALPYDEQTIRIGFFPQDHGDGYPLYPGILAHAYPPGPGLGGDVHINNQYIWNENLLDGANSPYVVMLHELGHSNGLMHNPNPASIMYAFASNYAAFSIEEDVPNIQSLYSPRWYPDPPGPDPHEPPRRNVTLTIDPPPATTTASSITISGVLQGGSGVYPILAYRSDRGAEDVGTGSAYWQRTVPLELGVNVISLLGGGGATAQELALGTVTVTRIEERRGSGMVMSDRTDRGSPPPSGETPTEPPPPTINDRDSRNAPPPPPPPPGPYTGPLLLNISLVQTAGDASHMAKLQAAVDLIRAHSSEFTVQQIGVLQLLTRIEIGVQGPFVNVFTGVFSLTPSYIAASSVIWLASAIAHDAYHIELARTGQYWMGADAERACDQFQIAVGRVFGLVWSGREWQ